MLLIYFVKAPLRAIAFFAAFLFRWIMMLLRSTGWQKNSKQEYSRQYDEFYFIVVAQFFILILRFQRKHFFTTLLAEKNISFLI